MSLPAAPALWRAGRRAITALITLIVVVLIVFFALHLLAGNFAELYLGPTATPEQIDALNKRYGLDQPLFVQLFAWVSQVATGQFGISLVSGQPVSALLALRAPVTVQLAVYALTITIMVGVPFGLLLGTVGTGQRSAGGFRVASALSVSFPDFVIGSLIVYLLSTLAPTMIRIGSYSPFVEDPMGNFLQMIFPALTLAIFPTAVLVRTLRDSARATAAEPFVKAAQRRGETRGQIIRRHVLRNAALPAITVLAISFGYLLSGAVIVENIFGLPGMGQGLINAITQRDYAVVQSFVLLGAGSFIVVGLIAESLYGFVDPRLRHAAA